MDLHLLIVKHEHEMPIYLFYDSLMGLSKIIVHCSFSVFLVTVSCHGWKVVLNPHIGV